MYPILNSAKKISLFAVAWIPVMIGVGYVHSLLVPTSYLNALILLAPVLLFKALFFIGIWFISSATPLDSKKIVTIVSRHLIAAIVIITIWLHISMLYSQGLLLLMPEVQWLAQYERIMPVLSVVGFFTYLISAMVSYLFITLEKARETEQQAMDTQLKATQAELRFLKSTIHPHFLFNSLNALSTLTQTSANKAQQVCIQLAQFLRYSLNHGNKELVTLADELNHIKNYLNVEKTRIGKRLSIEYDVDENLLNEHILSFSLQPLVENAIKHGIEPGVDGGVISVLIKKANNYIFVNISNPMPEHKPLHPESGHGLPTLQSRLKKIYADDVKILAHKGEKAFSIKLYLPILNRLEDASGETEQPQPNKEHFRTYSG